MKEVSEMNIPWGKILGNHSDGDQKPRIVVIGDVVLDRYFWGVSERISSEAPVPVVDLQEETITLGGAGFIGSNLIQGLNNQGITDIIVVDNLSNN